jgi:hypothetical protein
MTFGIREVSKQNHPRRRSHRQRRVIATQRSGKRFYAARYGSDRWLQGANRAVDVAIKRSPANAFASSAATVADTLLGRRDSLRAPREALATRWMR